MEEKAQKILEQATQLFMQYGVRSQTMDDIARQIGISKKTLYQVVSDKAELVETAIKFYLEHDKQELERLHDESENAIDEMFMLSKRVRSQLIKMHPSILYDLEKYYPESFAHYRNYTLKTVMACVIRNLEEGIAQGFYRERLNIPIVAGLYTGRMDLIFDRNLFPPSKYSSTDVYFEAIRYHIRGVASEKGIAYLKEKFKTIDKQNPIF